MSVIVAIKDNDKVYVGCDSQTTKGRYKNILNNKNNCKIWEVPDVDNTVMGSVGNSIDGLILRNECLFPESVVLKDQIDYYFIQTQFAQHLYSELDDNNLIRKKDENLMESSYLLAHKDQLYIIDSDLCVFEKDEIATIGSGKDIALGSLLSTKGKDPVYRLLKALDACVSYDSYIDYPFVITNTDGVKFEVFDRKDVKKYLENYKGGE